MSFGLPAIPILTQLDYYVRAVLSLYFVYQLHYSEVDAKLLFHTFSMLVYFFPILGAIISDSLLGKFHTILYVSVIYVIGTVVLSLAATEPLHLPMREISMLGLLLIAIGTGGIKPCVSAFGGDQFTLPQQEAQLAQFFSWFYFSINCGSLISTILTPVIRAKFQCFGQETCFPLAFGVPGMLMILALLLFLVGKRLYKLKKPKGNIVIKVMKCVTHASKQKCKKSKGEKKEHWLDWANDKYDQELIEDIKMALRVLYLYIPIPFFWALFDQQGTGWTFMATRMNGDIGFTTILPDQMQVANPLLIIVFIPLFNYAVYPWFARCDVLKKPLTRMEVGGFLTAISFVISAIIQLKIEGEYPVLPGAGQGHLRIYNSLPCGISIQSATFNHSVPPLSIFENRDLKIGSSNETIQYTAATDSSCSGINPKPLSFEFSMAEKQIVGHFVKINKDNQLRVINYTDKVEKDKTGMPLLRLLTTTTEDATQNISLYSSNGEKKVDTNTSENNAEKLFSVFPDIYKIKVNGAEMGEIEVELGGVYTALVSASDSVNVKIKLITITPPNELHILWLLPQYVVITCAEIMLSITGLEFSYSQAPASMKSILQAAWLLTVAFGNLLVVIIEKIRVFDSQGLMFFLYAGLMAVDMTIFTLMAWRYKYFYKEESKTDMDTEAKAVEVENKN